MAIYCLNTIILRLILFFLPILLTSLSLILLKNKKLFVFCIIVTILNGYFMFLHNQIQVSPIYKDELSSSDVFELYNTFKNSTQSFDGYKETFRSENNFYGKYKFEKNDRTNLENEDQNYKYQVDKYLKLNRDYSLFGTPIDYSGKIMIYSKEDNLTLTIYYKMYLKNENSQRMFSFNEFSCSGVNEDYSLKNISLGDQ